MDKNKLVLVVMIAFCFGCFNNKTKESKIRAESLQLEDPILQEEIKLATKINDIDSLENLKSKLDSIIMLKKYSGEGYYYFQRAECFASLELFELANKDLKMAKRLNYMPDRCEFLMKFNERLLKIKTKYN